MATAIRIYVLDVLLLSLLYTVAGVNKYLSVYLSILFVFVRAWQGYSQTGGDGDSQTGEEAGKPEWREADTQAGREKDIAAGGKSNGGIMQVNVPNRRLTTGDKYAGINISGFGYTHACTPFSRGR